MKETKKAVKIISELMTYYFANRATSFKIDFNRNKIENNHIEFVIKIRGKLAGISNEEINNLRKSLNIKREVQVEEYYWELAGEDNQGQEMDLVGMLTDKGLVEYDNEELIITLWRQVS